MERKQLSTPLQDEAQRIERFHQELDRTALLCEAGRRSSWAELHRLCSGKLFSERPMCKISIEQSSNSAMQCCYPWKDMRQRGDIRRLKTGPPSTFVMKASLARILGVQRRLDSLGTVWKLEISKVTRLTEPPLKKMDLETSEALAALRHAGTSTC